MEAKRDWRTSRPAGFAVIGLIYVVASAFGVAVFTSMDGAPWLRLLAADAAATVLVWSASWALDNASVYDPYWSVQPIVILDLWLVANGRFDLSALALASLLNVWGVRLTANWAVTFRGLGVQDWRYDRIRAATGPLWPLANLAGIQLMPTLIVYACTLPAFLYLGEGGAIGPVGILGLAASLLGVALETVADAQQHAFRKQADDRTRINDLGLWKHARHPNYLGEILVWWGVAVVFAGAFPSRYFLGFGAAVNTALFLFISIPLAERRLAEYKAGYAAYRARTRMLLPIPTRADEDRREA